MDESLFTSLAEYKESYNTRLENHLKEYIDYDEFHFIKSELTAYQSYYTATNIKKNDHNGKIFIDPLYSPIVEDVEISNIKLMQLMFNFGIRSNNYYNVEVCEKLSVSFSKIIEFLTNLQDEKANIPIMSDLPPESTSKLNWAGTELELSELIKALIQAKKISPELTQTEIFKRFKDLLNVSNFNESDKLKDIRKRTNTLTPFINTLGITLSNWIKAKD